MQRMVQSRNQTAIKNQLDKYLVAQNITESFLKILPTAGYCYAFSVCRAAMRITGQLSWWEAVIDKVLAWDGQLSSLEDKFLLPDATNGEPISLQALFERIIHYIVFNQASSRKYPYAKFSQYNFLHPQGPFLLLMERKFNSVFMAKNESDLTDIPPNTLVVFQEDNMLTVYWLENGKIINKSFQASRLPKEITQNLPLVNTSLTDRKLINAITSQYGCTLQDEILQIKENYKIAGHYSRADLANILNDNATVEAIKNNICLVLSNDHGCELSYIDGQWLFFDPSSPDGKAQSFDNVNDLAQHIVSILGRSISIELACVSALSSKPFSYFYEYLLVKSPVHLIEGDGFLFISGQTPEMVPQLLANLKSITNPPVLKFFVNKANRYGVTPLMIAAEIGHTEAIEALLSYEANPNINDRDGVTALMIAAQNGHPEVIKVLLSYGADPRMVMSADVSVLVEFATEKGRNEILEALLKRQNNNILPATIDSFTALDLAVFFGHIEIVTILLNKMPGLGIKKLSGLREIAQAMDHFEIDNLLLSSATQLNSDLKNKGEKKQKRSRLRDKVYLVQLLKAIKR